MVGFWRLSSGATPKRTNVELVLGLMKSSVLDMRKGTGTGGRGARKRQHSVVQGPLSRGPLWGLVHLGVRDDLMTPIAKSHGVDWTSFVNACSVTRGRIQFKDPLSG